MNELKENPTMVQQMQPLAGGHPDVAKSAILEHANTGGSTFEPMTGRNLAGSRHMAVSIEPESAVIHHRPFTADQYSAFVDAHRDKFEQHPNLAVGTHHDPETGLHHMELVAVTPSKVAAHYMTKDLGQKHFYNLSTDEQHPVEQEDPHIPAHMALHERMAELNAQSPHKTTYSGVHYGAADSGMINGAHRGLAGNADAERVRLGSQTGMGHDAPEGFYTHKSGSLPDAKTAAEKTPFLVRGRMAFASTEDPAFKAGYSHGVDLATSRGADAKTAHLLGLNSAEHALKDAGFDGIQSPAHPNLRFHFGSAAAIPHGNRVAPELAPIEAPPTSPFGGK